MISRLCKIVYGPYGDQLAAHTKHLEAHDKHIASHDKMLGIL
jgi:hypothetical protein